MGLTRLIGVTAIALVVTAVLSAQAVTALANIMPGAGPGASVGVVVAVAVVIGGTALHAVREGGA